MLKDMICPDCPRCSRGLAKILRLLRLARHCPVCHDHRFLVPGQTPERIREICNTCTPRPSRYR